MPGYEGGSVRRRESRRGWHAHAYCNSVKVLFTECYGNVYDSSVGAELGFMDHPPTRAESKGDIDLRLPRRGIRGVGREAGVIGGEILQNLRLVCGDEIQDTRERGVRGKGSFRRARSINNF